MRYSKWMAWAAVAAGMVFSTTTLRADDRDRYEDRQHIRHDWERVNRLRGAVAADQYGLNEDVRYGRYRAAEKDRRDLYNHQRELDRQLSDVRHDRAAMSWDRR